MKKYTLAIFTGLFLQGCAKEITPTYPTQPTAVIRTRVQNLGFKGLFASESSQTVSTRAHMRRTEDQFQFSGMFMKHLAGARDSASIWRIDKNIQWHLDIGAKTYSECPLSGCVSALQAPSRQPEPAAEPERPQKKPSCKMTLAKNHFAVKSTGETRAINGFNTKEYKIAWDVVLEDAEKKKDTSSLAIDLWTTSEDDARIASVKAVERKFEEDLHAKRPEDARLGKIIPAAAMKILASQFLDGLSADQRAALTGASQELAKIHGLPISTRLDWYLDGNACAGAATENKPESSSGLDLAHGVGGLFKSATGMAATKGVEHEAGQMAGKPVFGFVEEVQSMRVEEASDGLFVPPPNFKRVDPR